MAIASGERKTVWSQEETVIIEISLASKAGLLAVGYFVDRDHDFLTVAVIDPASGQSTPVHFGSTGSEGSQPLSTAISPDGKWLAMSVPAEKENETYLGAIVSADGRQMRFFLPKLEMKVVIPEILRRRMDTALKVVKLEEALEEIDFDEMANEESIRTILATTDRVAGEHKAPIFQEAIAYGKVQLLFEMIEDDPPAAARVKILAAAGKQLKKFLAAYPDHPIGPALRQQLDELAKAPAEPPEADALEAE